MHTRIKQIRKNAGLNMEQFAKKIGITRSSISRIESGENNPSDQTVILICREFKVNEEWLRTGSGSPYKQRTKNQQLLDFSNELMEDLDESFRKRFVLALSKLNEDDWKSIEKIADNLKEEG